MNEEKSETRVQKSVKTLDARSKLSGLTDEVGAMLHSFISHLNSVS